MKSLLLVFGLIQRALAQVAGTHTDIPRWCGKPYMVGAPNFDPGGQLEPPAPSPSPKLYVQVEPRHSIYVGRETTGTFIVDAALSYIFGEPFTAPQRGYSPYRPSTYLDFSINVVGTDQVLVSNRVRFNSTDNLFEFDLTKLQPRLDVYSISLSASFSDDSYSHGGRHHHGDRYGNTNSPNGNMSYTATTQLYYLPDKTTGSITKVDNLYGGLLFSNNVTNHQFVPWLPYGGYADYSGWFYLSLDNIKSYFDEGFNTVHPVTDLYGNYTVILDYLDELNLLWQFDMRGSYLNLSSVASQVEIVKDYSSLLLYYTADEPDGWEYALDSTVLAYNTIASVDKYHPVSLVLNCRNFYFQEYSAGADIIMEDAYPIGLNATFSRRWHTPCNDTYGDCGCDDCIGSITDVSTVLDAYTTYSQWLGQQTSKPLWAVPQGFYGEDYWARLPTMQEAWAMSILAFNHRAKGVMIWIFPLTETLTQAHSQLAKVVTVQPVLGFLTGAQPQQIQVSGFPSLDVAYWVVGQQIMVGVVNEDYAATAANVQIELPFRVRGIAEQPWGSADWTLDGNKVWTNGLEGLATSFVILDL